MDRVHLGLAHEVGAHVVAARRDANEPALDERGERPVQNGLQIGIDQIQLDQHHSVVLVQLRQAVQRWDRADVACPKHQADLPGQVGVAQPAGHPRLRLLQRHPWPQPHVRCVAHHHPILRDSGKDAQRDLTAWQPAHPHPVQRVRAGLKLFDEPDDRSDVRKQRVRPAHPLLAGGRRVHCDALALAGHAHPLLSDLRSGAAQGLQELALLRQRCSDPIPCRGAEDGEVAVEDSDIEHLSLL